MRSISFKNLKSSTIFQIYTISILLLGTLLTTLTIFLQLPYLTRNEISLQQFLWQTILVVTGISFLAIALTAFLYRRFILQPIELITRESKKFIENDQYQSEPIAEPTGLEFKELVHSFNQMTGHLKEFKTGVEDKVTERTRLLEEASRLVQEVLDTTPNMLCLLNTEIDQFNYVNREFADFFGVDSEEMISLGPVFMRGRLFPNDQANFKKHEQALLVAKDEEVTETDYRIANSKGEWRWLSIRSIIFQRNRENKPKLVLHVGQDITNLKETEEKLRFLSIHDQLTGLYNRLYFDEEIYRLEHGRVFPISVIMADLDNLKWVNDTFGHSEGDEMLRVAASILKSSFRAEDVVARMGGDEFAALLPGANQEAVSKIIERINEKIQHHPLFRSRAMIGISLGSATIQKGDSLDEALKLADAQMYLVKQSRKSDELV